MGFVKAAGAGGGSAGLEWALEEVMCGTALARRGRIRWERRAHGQALGRVVVRFGCATRGTNHDAATTMLSDRSLAWVGDWVCDARGTGIETVASHKNRIPDLITQDTNSRLNNTRHEFKTQYHKTRI